MKREEDDFAAYRQQQKNQAAPFSYIYPQMPPRFRWCRRFAQALFLIERGGFVVLVLSNFPTGVVALLWGKKALLEGVGAMAFLLSMVSFVLLPLAFLARWLRHTAKLFWHCPCYGQPFPYYAPDGRHEEMRNKECCYTLRQMRIGYVKTKLCPLVIPSECPACRQKFFKMENIPLNKRQTRT